MSNTVTLKTFMNLQRKSLLIPILFLSATIVRGDTFEDATEADAKRIASHIDRNDILLEICRGCDSLRAYLVLDAKATKIGKYEIYRGNLPYKVNLTSDLFFESTGPLTENTNGEITVSGRCLTPDISEVKEDCYDGEEGMDGVYMHNFRCKAPVSLNYSYFKRDENWLNFVQATREHDAISPETHGDTVKINEGTWEFIYSCYKQQKNRVSQNQ